MSKSTKDSIRITKNAAMVAAPKNIDQANEIITRIGTAERKIRQIENGKNGERGNASCNGSAVGSRLLR